MSKKIMHIANNAPLEKNQAITKANLLGDQGLTKASETPKWIAFVIAFLLSISIYFAYQPALDNDFVDWDDYTYVLDNPMVRNDNVGLLEIFKKPVSLNYHPLTMWSMKINNNTCETCLQGISAKPFILGNLWLHIANALLVFYLMSKFTKGNIIVAGLMAFLFGVHPMHIESVAWVSERKDVLYTFFFLSAMATYWRFLNHNKKVWLLPTFLLFIAACLSKAMAVVFPLVMILMQYWHNKEKNESWKIPFKINNLLILFPFLLSSLLFGLIAVKIQSGNNFLGLFDIQAQTTGAISEFSTFNLMQRLHFAAYGFVSYIINFFYPHNLSPYYEYPTLLEYESNFMLWNFYLLGMIALLGLALYWFLKGEKLWQKAYVFGIGFYFITIVLVLQFLSVGVVIKADRYTYLPYIGLAFSLLMPYSLSQKKYIYLGHIAFLVLGISFIFKTQKEVNVWQNSDTLWQRVIDTQQHQGLKYAYGIRGHYFGKMAEKSFAKNKAQEGQAYLNKAWADLEKAKQLGSENADVYEGLGNIYGMQNNYALALENYAKAIELEPNKSNAYFNLGVTYGLQQNYAKAVEIYDKVAMLNFPYTERLYSARALAALQAGLYEKAISDLLWLTQNNPNEYNNWANLGVAYMNVNNKNAAQNAFQKALTLKPNDAFVLERLNAL